MVEIVVARGRRQQGSRTESEKTESSSDDDEVFSVSSSSGEAEETQLECIVISDSETAVNEED
eukprot:4355045-Karenia_brevis.AAC.1